MKFAGKTRIEQRRAYNRWSRWMRLVGRESRKARFAVRFVAEVEAHTGRPGPHVAQVVVNAMTTANREALNSQSLTDAELVEVIQALTPVWKYGESLHKWAVSRGYIEEA
jgi:hypothetical protein